MKRPFEEIVAEHGPTVLRVCRAVLARPDADDAWSETFLAALRAYPDLADNANIEAWLVTIAHRKAIDASRAESRRASPVAVAVEPRSAAGGWEPLDGDLWAALGALPTKQRQAVAYHHVAGLPYAEVAALVGGSTDAARRAAHDGIRALRRRYLNSTTVPPQKES
jgi:RNA polymerase sigma factor (sigma-70 family)